MFMFHWLIAKTEVVSFLFGQFKPKNPVVLVDEDVRSC